MNRDNELEKRLLSRSYDSAERIQELLDTRYSLTGGQKPHLLFKQTTAEKKQTISLTAGVEKSKSLLQQTRRTTRHELRAYFQTTMQNQRKLIRRAGKLNPNQIQKYIKQYDIPDINDFAALNVLWQKYIGELLFPEGNIGALSVLLPKLSSADFNGCLVTVTQSVNTTLVGIRGIVVWDAQHSFIICVPRDNFSREWNESKAQSDFTPSQHIGGFRMVPKKGTRFSFDVIVGEEECVGFTLLGSRFEFRAVDRAGKKFKNHNVDDI